MTAPKAIDNRLAKNKLDFDFRTCKLINQNKQSPAYKTKCAILSSKPVLSFGTSERCTKLKTPNATVYATETL